MSNMKIKTVIITFVALLLFGLRIYARYDRVMDRIDLATQFSELVQDSSADNDKTPEESEPVPTTASEVLESLNYYGTPETCAMTAEQARAYAKLLHNRHFLDDAEERPKFWILLGDFSGDGNPYLYINRLHQEDIPFSQWSNIIIDSTEIYGWKDSTAQVIYEQSEVAPSLEKQHKLTGSIILAERQRPNETDWCGKYYNFADGDIHLQYHWEKYFNWDDELWYFTENERTVTYTSDEYYALPSDMRNDPISRDIVLSDESSLSGLSFSVTEMCDALNLYADFLETQE